MNDTTENVISDNTYYLRLKPVDTFRTPTDYEKWEEVDETVFKNKDKCLNGELSRYTGDYVSRDASGKTLIHVSSGEITTIIAALRISGVTRTVIDTLMCKAGLVVRPEMVKMVLRKGKTVVHENFKGNKPLSIV